MKKEDFLKMLDNREYGELEEKLKREYAENRNNEVKYQLGICYGNQFKIEDAKKIFKELMNTDFKPPYIYSFNARHTKGNIEKVKILKQGLRIYPDNIIMNNQLLCYLENEEKEEYYIELEKKNMLHFSSVMEMISYYFEKEDFANVSKIFKDKKELLNYSDLSEKDIELIRILSCYLNNEEIDLNEINLLMISENNAINDTILRLIEIDIVSNKDIVKAQKLLKQINYNLEFQDDFIELISFSNYNSYCFPIKKVLFNIIEKLEMKFDTEEDKRKLRIIKSIYYLFWEENKIKKTELRLIEKDLKEELKYDEKAELYYFLLDIYEKINDNKKYFISYINFIEKCEIRKKHVIEFECFNEMELNYAIDYICKNIRIYDFNSRIYQELIESLIKELHERKKFEEIIRITENIDIRKLNYLNFGFELAYSYKNLNMDKEAKKMYEEYVIKNPDSAAAINNLGVIYEKEGNIEKALELYEKAEGISHDKIQVNNIKRCNELIEERKKEEEKAYEALELFEKENIWIINELKLFYSVSDENNNVICSYSRLPILLKCGEAKAQELLNKFLHNNYILKNKNHNYDTTSSVYKINTVIYERIKKIDKENEIVSNFTDNLNNFTIENLKNLDYVEIYQKLSEIEDEKIKNIFIRDYNELIYNYLSNQSKTVVLMSGTIIELLLLYILELNNITQYSVGTKPKNKKIEEMDITEMLEVSTAEKLIHNAPQKFIDGMKNFRNFVHPGKELREKLLEIDKQTVDLLMSIVRWLILTLDLK